MRNRAYSKTSSAKTMPLSNVCVVLADMEGSTKFWAWAFDPTIPDSMTERIHAAWEAISMLQTQIIREVLHPRDGREGQFIKGVGDELIFRMVDVTHAFKAAKDAIKVVSAFNSRKRFASFKVKPKLPLAFRFLIHITPDGNGLIPGQYIRGKITLSLQDSARVELLLVSFLILSLRTSSDIT